MKRSFQLVFLLAVPAVGLFAQGGYANFPDRMGNFLWKESDPVSECYKGTWHNVTYARLIFGSGNSNIFIRDEDTGVPCDCTVGPVVQLRPQIRPLATDGFSLLRPPEPNSFSALRPRQETNCKSPDTNGNEQTIPGQQAAGSTSGFGGPGSFAGGGSSGSPPGPPDPSGLGGTLAARPARTPLALHAATSGSAFTYSLSFRDLPAAPFLADATSQPPVTCNANLNPTMFRVYHTSNVVKRYNLCTLATLATIQVPDLPLQVRVTPDGSRAIVTSYSGPITFIDTGTNAMSGSILSSDPNFTPSGLAISPNGHYALVTNYEPPPESYVVVIDVANMKIVHTIFLDTEYPESVFINPDGTLAWITFPWDDRVEVMDILTGTIIQAFNVSEPFSIVFDQTGTRAFVSSGFGSVEVFDTATYQVIKNIPADLGATDLQITADGTFVYVNNSAAQSVTVIDTNTLTAVTGNVGAEPQGSTLVPSQ